MNIRDLQVSMIDMVMCLSQATDVVSHAVANHQKRVAYISCSLAGEMGYSGEACNRLLMAGALHDVGALSLRERLSALAFEATYPEMRAHASAGAALLRTFPPLTDVASLVEHHHSAYRDRDESTPAGANLLHLADRVDVLLDHRQPLLSQVPGICERIQAESGQMFDPLAVTAFLILARRESFWLDLAPNLLDRALLKLDKTIAVDLNLTNLMDFARLFGQIIDFRSRFTATHSSGVAATAEAIAGLVGMSRAEGRLLKVAGYLHDLGKLAIPTEVLEKPGRLTSEEYDLVRSHTFHTYRILETVKGLETLAAWAAFHHERLDGTGYPFRCSDEELGINSRIMAVADVFTAITEDRPYRAGMDSQATARVLTGMAESGGLDRRLVKLLLDNFASVDAVRRQAQADATRSYKEFWLRLDQQDQTIPASVAH